MGTSNGSGGIIMTEISGSGNRLPLTSQEVVEQYYGRYRQSNSGTTSDSRQNAIGPDNDVNRPYQLDDNGHSEETRRYDASDTGTQRPDSGDRHDSEQSNSGGRPAGANYSGTYQYNGGLSGSTEYLVTGQQPVKKSKFRFANVVQPYLNEIKKSTKSASKSKKDKPKVKLLTEAEVRLKRQELIDVLLWSSEHMDQIIIATTRDHVKTLIIWSDLDREEAAILADFLLNRSRVDTRAAAAVRGLLELQNKIKLGTILLPRIYRTASYYLSQGFSIR